MKQGIWTIRDNRQIARDVFLMRLEGDATDITRPGQFINIKLDGMFLRRPISVCDWNSDGVTVIYKVVGKGTEQMSRMSAGEDLDVLSGLGNGFDISAAGDAPVVIGGGVGVPPMYGVAKKLAESGRCVSAVLGFNTAADVFFVDEFKKICHDVRITTADGSLGQRGFVTDALADMQYSYLYTCGPEPMLKAVWDRSTSGGQYSFEERMGCGFGACMGCSCKTKYGNKRICKDGPVLVREELIW